MGWLSAPLCGVCHTTCSSSSFLTAAPVPFSQLHSTAPHPFHFTMLTAMLFASVPGILPPSTFPIKAGCTVPFASPLHGSLGSIPLLPRYFISAGFSTPAAHFYFARRPPHLGCVHLAAAIAHSSLISQSIAKVHLHSSATSVPCGKYSSVASYGAAIAPDVRAFPGSPFMGARRPPPLRRSSLFRRPSNGSQSLQCGQVCRTAMLLILPQALLPADLIFFEVLFNNRNQFI